MKNIIAATMMFAALSAFADKVVDVRAEATDGFGGDLSSVLTRCQTKAGGEYDPVTLSRDVVALRESKPSCWTKSNLRRCTFAPSRSAFRSCESRGMSTQSTRS